MLCRRCDQEKAVSCLYTTTQISEAHRRTPAGRTEKKKRRASRSDHGADDLWLDNTRSGHLALITATEPIGRGRGRGVEASHVIKDGRQGTYNESRVTGRVAGEAARAVPDVASSGSR